METASRGPGKRRSGPAAALAGLLGALFLGGPGCGARVADRIERIGTDAIAFPAVVTRSRFERRFLGMPGYHLVVWGDGEASPAALFQASVSDAEVIDALQSLGAKPGNALGMDTWEERRNPRSTAPDKIIEGPGVEVLVRVPGRTGLLTLDQILLDSGGRGFEMRFGGHRANIHQWHSGCIICLYSCPGSKVGNARNTVRDFVSGTTRFRVRPGVLPRDGSEVTLLLRLSGSHS